DAARRLRRGSHREVSIEADELEEAQALTYDDDAHLVALFLAESLLRDQKDRRLLALLTEGYSQKEAAAILGMSQQAVSARLRRMRRGAFA
ncbi:MAG TPA: winged helix-turn-helix transcriptional regulator, partial [Thermosynergistes sp.]|nr:winged helix-turn-helix transcriptional regulator [Thermosynergistes sp.]